MNNNYEKDSELLHAYVDDELNGPQREQLLGRLDDEPELRGELCDIQRVKDLMQFSYPQISEKSEAVQPNTTYFRAMAASLLLVLSLGFLGGYLVFDQKKAGKNQIAAELDDGAVQISNIKPKKQKVVIYLGSSGREKFDQVFDKAEALLTKYKDEGAEVYVVTSGAGIDLLRSGNTYSEERIKVLSGLYKSLHFVACNNQIYQLHKKGKDVNLVDEAEVAPSAVQFVVDHLAKGWKYIAI